MSDIVSYYELKRVEIPPPGPDELRFATAALMCCRLCGRVIDVMGGPGEAICIPCGDVVKNGKALGAIKWTGETDE